MAMTTTLDNKYLFVSDHLGMLEQISLETEEMVSVIYKKLQNGPIICMQPTKDGKHMITAGSSEVKRISIKHSKVKRSYGWVEGNGAHRIAIFPDGEKLLLGDKQGNLVMT